MLHDFRIQSVAFRRETVNLDCLLNVANTTIENVILNVSNGSWGRIRVDEWT